MESDLSNSDKELIRSKNEKLCILISNVLRPVNYYKPIRSISNLFSMFLSKKWYDITKSKWEVNEVYMMITFGDN